VAIISFHQRALEGPFHDGVYNSLRAFANADGMIMVTTKSIKLFDVCNAFVDMLQNAITEGPSAVDIVIFNLINDGAIPSIPRLIEDEMHEFIQKIAHAYSSITRLSILRTIRRVHPITVSRLEMHTGIFNQTLRRHLRVLAECRLVSKTRIGQTYLYDRQPHRLPSMTYLWNALFWPETTDELEGWSQPTIPIDD